MNYQLFEQNELIKFALSILKRKAKIELTADKLIELIKDKDLKTKLISNQTEDVCIDEIEYELLSREVLSCVGYVSSATTSPLVFAPIYKKYETLDSNQSLLLADFASFLSENLSKEQIDFSFFLEKVLIKYGNKYLAYSFDVISCFFEKILSSPYYKKSKYDNIDPILLNDLFKKEKNNSLIGKYFDQRYIDYLYQNFNDLSSIHWRKFEELTAQFFENDGYEVVLGPGRKDGGVDIIASKNNKTIIIQCKRWKNKINGTIVKALNDDVIYEKRDKGIFMCIKGVSPDATRIIEERKYKIEICTQNDIFQLLEKYKTTL